MILGIRSPKSLKYLKTKHAYQLSGASERISDVWRPNSISITSVTTRPPPWPNIVRFGLLYRAPAWDNF